MSDKYRTIGTLGNTVRVRTQNKWIIVFPDGEEVKFSNKKFAMLAIKVVISWGQTIRVYEETLMRFKKNDRVNDEHFRIEITERIKLMMKLER